MSYHIIDISETTGELHWKKGQLICVTSSGSRSIPLEDVGSIIITSFLTQLSSLLLREVAKKGVSFIVCENFKPVSITLPVMRATDTSLIRSQITSPKQFRDRLWRKTIDAKCHNQFKLLERLIPDFFGKKKMEVIVKANSPTKESECARIFWRVYSEKIHPGRTFTRSRTGGTLNDLLNYAYAVLLSLVLQRLLAIGIDPTFGIGHVVRAKATPLAYDVMEPFRPIMDAQVARWVIQNEFKEDAYRVTPEYKRFLLPVLAAKFSYEGEKMELQLAIEKALRSFRTALIEQQTGLYKPWQQTTTRWDGC